MSRYNNNRHKGTSLAEAAASMVVMVPLMMMLMFVTVEVSYSCFLVNNLAQASRTAARSLAIAYGADPTIVGDRSKENSQVFNQIRIANVVNDSDQFNDPVWQTTTQPYTVSVTVRYLSGQYSLPVFPVPDALNIGQNYQPVAQSTFRLE